LSAKDGTSKLEQRCFSKHKPHSGCPIGSALYRAVCSRQDHSVTAGGLRARFLFLVTLTFDLGIQTRPSDRPNTSLLSIWCKSVQRFQRYLIHKQNQKKSQTVLKQKLACVW